MIFYWSFGQGYGIGPWFCWSAVDASPEEIGHDSYRARVQCTLGFSMGQCFNHLVSSLLKARSEANVSVDGLDRSYS